MVLGERKKSPIYVSSYSFIFFYLFWSPFITFVIQRIYNLKNRERVFASRLASFGNEAVVTDCSGRRCPGVSWFTRRLPLSIPAGKILWHFYRTLIAYHRKTQRKHHPNASISFTEFSQKCLVNKRTTMSSEEKEELEDVTKVYKSDYRSFQRERRGSRISVHRTPSFNLVLACSAYDTDIKGEQRCCRRIGRTLNNTEALWVSEFWKWDCFSWVKGETGVGKRTLPQMQCGIPNGILEEKNDITEKAGEIQIKSGV